MSSAGRRRGMGCYRRLADRAVFATALLAFLVIGIILVGDFAAQWWVLLLPLALLVGPALALRRAAGRGLAGDEGENPWRR